MFKFEKLAAWNRAIVFADDVYAASSAFPADERFGLTNQIRRAAVSISSNIAEGSARSDADYAKFVTYAAGSLYEVVSQAHIAKRQGFLIQEAFDRLRTEAEEISRMLSGLRRTLDGAAQSS